MGIIRRLINTVDGPLQSNWRFHKLPKLTLSLALSRQKWGKARPSMPSRFLYEVTGQADNPNYVAAVTGRRARRVTR